MTKSKYLFSTVIDPDDVPPNHFVATWTNVETNKIYAADSEHHVGLAIARIQTMIYDDCGIYVHPDEITVRYPDRVQKKYELQIISSYQENPDLESFDILHLYSRDIAFPHGYTDCRFMRVVGFNREMGQKREFLQNVDGIRLAGDLAEMSVINIAYYLDGGLYIQFRRPIQFIDKNGQALFVIAS